MTDSDKTALVLKLMTRKQAEVWGLVFDGYMQREIAATLCKTQQAVSRLTNRGRRRVKKQGDLLKKTLQNPNKGL